MKNNISSIILICFAILFSMQSCDKDKFAELNSDPSVVSEPDVRFLVTKSMQEMYDNDYTLWFYTQFGYVYPYSQVLTASTAGNNTTFTTGGLSGIHNIYRSIVPAVDARMRIDKLTGEKRESSRAMSAVTYPVQIYAALANLDYIGGFPYSEAGLASYTTPSLLTPKVETEEELFNKWLEELNFAIDELSLEDQFPLGNQDIIYRGAGYGKWVKFCNLLKLRIAARLVNVDKARAIKIAEEVAASSYMDELDDDCLFSEGVNYYGTGDGLSNSGFASKNLTNFLKSNKDPRLRFIFRKNDFSPEVIDAIIQTNGFASLPAQIQAVVDTTEEGAFANWKAGNEEPWVRYWGVPLSTDSTTLNDYFQQSTRFYATKSDGKGKKTYVWTSLLEEKNLRTTYSFTYPTKPGGEVHQILGYENTFFVVLGSAAETNLYLAEFKLLGANLSKDANEYFQKGIRLSVERMDALAKLHENPYYAEDPVLESPETGATKLRDGEIIDLLAQPAYTLNGTDDLEKVYLQQYIHFVNTPGDLWTTVRRSGVPKIGSAYLPWEEFGVSNIPRRVMLNSPNEADLDYKNWDDYYQNAGITTGVNTPSVLSSERLWFDKQNPNYGEGPK